jgi:hypothetical protein
MTVSDGDRIRAALDAADAPAAERHLRVVKDLYRFIVAGSLEWSVRWAAAVAAYASAERADEIARDVFARWRVAALRDEALEAIAPFLDPDAARIGSLADWQAAVQRGPDEAFDEVLEALARSDFGAARERFERFLARARRRHDLLLRFIWAFGSGVLRVLGQPAAEACTAESFHGSSFYDPMWRKGERMTQAEIAALLTEHLRAHFTGPGRDGGVEVVEEPDRFRLLMHPCGSGGALRRDRALADRETFGVLREASPSTWMRTDGVPTYCAHCAQNEIESMRRLGYPAWVTEFDPDPSAPCCWTVFKDPREIPDVFFERIGAVKDPSRFRKPG